ncbi:hypothetical protein [Arthrobacter sp. VKM Ac-2550]|uniref:hypothetical protein n=1 Tax=Crystallibacter permensis TaxID=1938888 RepID=UPI002227AB12|nr:hypothetical protein [Arthrobacter sp. VKM Ac-2550]
MGEDFRKTRHGVKGLRVQPVPGKGRAVLVPLQGELAEVTLMGEPGGVVDLSAIRSNRKSAGAIRPRLPGFSGNHE